MNSKNNPKDNIVEFIEEEAFYIFKKNKSEVEKGTLSIYIFATLNLLSLILTLIWRSDAVDWFYVAIYLLIIIVYFCLGVYSNHEPYTAFICTICVVSLVALSEILLISDLRIKGQIIKVVFIVFLFLKMNAAKYVQHDNKKQLNK